MEEEGQSGVVLERLTENPRDLAVLVQEIGPADMRDLLKQLGRDPILAVERASTFGRKFVGGNRIWRSMYKRDHPRFFYFVKSSSTKMLKSRYEKWLNELRSSLIADEAERRNASVWKLMYEFTIRSYTVGPPDPRAQPLAYQIQTQEGPNFGPCGYGQLRVSRNVKDPRVYFLCRKEIGKDRGEPHRTNALPVVPRYPDNHAIMLFGDRTAQEFVLAIDRFTVITHEPGSNVEENLDNVFRPASLVIDDLNPFFVVSMRIRGDLAQDSNTKVTRFTIWFSPRRFKSILHAVDVEGSVQSSLVDLCDNCQVKRATHRCSVCKIAFYCSADCQEKDWKDKHETVCSGSIK